MTTSTMKMPASYSTIEAEEMTYLDGGASNAYQSFLDIGVVSSTYFYHIQCTRTATKNTVF